MDFNPDQCPLVTSNDGKIAENTTNNLHEESLLQVPMASSSLASMGFDGIDERDNNLLIGASPCNSVGAASAGMAERDDSQEPNQQQKGTILGKRNIAQLAAEQIEPYVRRRRNSGSSSERSRKRTENLNEEEQNILRLCINSRERRRMHDLNDALDELRRVIPYTEGAQQQQQQQQNNARKISKINTIILATNWIRQLNNDMAQLKAQNEKLMLQLVAAKTTTTTTARMEEDLGKSRVEEDEVEVEKKQINGKAMIEEGEGGGGGGNSSLGETKREVKRHKRKLSPNPRNHRPVSSATSQVPNGPNDANANGGQQQLMFQQMANNNSNIPVQTPPSPFPSTTSTTSSIPSSIMQNSLLLQIPLHQRAAMAAALLNNANGGGGVQLQQQQGRIIPSAQVATQTACFPPHLQHHFSHQNAGPHPPPPFFGPVLPAVSLLRPPYFMAFPQITNGTNRMPTMSNENVPNTNSYMNSKTTKKRKKEPRQQSSVDSQHQHEHHQSTAIIPSNTNFSSVQQLLTAAAPKNGQSQQQQQQQNNANGGGGQWQTVGNAPSADLLVGLALSALFPGHPNPMANLFPRSGQEICDDSKPEGESQNVDAVQMIEPN